MSQSILIVDDDKQIHTALGMLLGGQGYQVVSATRPIDALRMLEQKPFAAALVDLNYQKDTTSGKEGLSLIIELKKRDPQLPLIVITGYASIEVAVQAMQSGAADFIEKPWGNARLLQVLRTQLALAKSQQQGQKLAAENALLKSRQAAFIAESDAMQQVLSQLKRLAKSEMNILLTGENGTGKSQLASYLHQHSARADQPFISVNMGAISDTLFESELFGHSKGAFTDAKQERLGRFELAEGGSLLLDEIANIPLNQQAKLLRVLEERQFERLGSSRTQQVDVRVISATNANLSAMIEAGEFRQDLLYRLNTVEIQIPALRERQADILPLAKHFAGQYASKYRLTLHPEQCFSPAAEHALLSYHWPGNVRELGHILERAVFLSPNRQIDLPDLSLPGTVGQGTQSATYANNLTLDAMEKQIIEQRLKHFAHHPQQTAESLGLSRSAYYRRLEKYGLLREIRE